MGRRADMVQCPVQLSWRARTMNNNNNNNTATNLQCRGVDLRRTCQFESRIKSHLIGEWNFRQNCVIPVGTVGSAVAKILNGNTSAVAWAFERLVRMARLTCVIISTQNKFKSYNKNSLNFHTIFMSTNFCNLKKPEKPWYIFRCTHIEYYINKSQSNIKEFSLFFRWRNSRSSQEIPPRCAWDIHIIKRNRISQPR